jgi:hypothetical protein
MKVYRNVQALWQAAAGSANPPFHTGQALGVRIVPSVAQGQAVSVGNYLPRTILVSDNTKRNNQIYLGDSGWFLIDRSFLLPRDDDDNHPFARTVGPRATLQFGIEQVGTSQSDTWNVWIAEDLLDLLAGPGPIVPLSRDESSGLYFPAVGNQGNGVTNVNFINPSIQILGFGAQLYDQTATASSALNSGTISTISYQDILIRISGLTAPTTRGLTVNAVRTDASVVPIWIPTAIGATVTDAVYSMGEGAAPPVAPIGATSVGSGFSSPLPIQMQFDLSTGTDTPRMTIWGRSGS